MKYASSVVTTEGDSCDLKQLVNQPIHLHSDILDLILSPIYQDTIVDKFAMHLIMHK